MKFVILIETDKGLDASMTGVVYEETLERAKAVKAGKFARFRDNIGNVSRDTL